MAIGLYLITTGIAVSLALAAALIVRPGAGAAPGIAAPHDIAGAPPFSQVLIDLVPRNPIAAMAHGDMLPVIVFAILFGLALTFAGAPGKRLAALFEDLNAAVMKLVDIVMLAAPYGVFALIATLAANTGWQAFAGLLKYVLLVLAVLAIHAGVVYPALMRDLRRPQPGDVLSQDARRHRLRLLDRLQQRHHSGDLAHGRGAARRGQSRLLLHHSAGRDDQYGRHGDHAGHRHRLHRPVLPHRSQPSDNMRW